MAVAFGSKLSAVAIRDFSRRIPWSDRPDVEASQWPSVCEPVIYTICRRTADTLLILSLTCPASSDVLTLCLPQAYPGLCAMLLQRSDD